MNLKTITSLGRYIPNPVTRTVGRTILKTQKHSPTILFGAGVIGVVGTVVLSSRATLKVDEVLTEHDKRMMDIKSAAGLGQQNYTEQDMRSDIRIVYTQTAIKIVKLYGPSVILGVSAIIALTGSHRILTTRNAGITAAYAALDQGFKEYRKRVVDEFGEDKDRELRYGSEERTIVEDTENGPKKVRVKTVGPHGASIYARFFDEHTKNWQPSQMANKTFIQCQQVWATDLLRSRGHVFLNEVYDMLGLERSSEGQQVGWLLDGDGDGYIDFGIMQKNNERVHDFMFGRANTVLLDFNVDGIIMDKIGKGSK